MQIYDSNTLEILFLHLMQGVLELSLGLLAVVVAAFCSHLLDPEPLPRLGGWGRHRWTGPEA